MEQGEKDQLREAQEKNEILATNEFDFPSPKFDILPKEGVIILRIQGFNVVTIIRLNPDLAKARDLALVVTHTIMYTKVQIWLRARDGIGSWTIIA
jgi:hypothetical protein